MKPTLKPLHIKQLFVSHVSSLGLGFETRAFPVTSTVSCSLLGSPQPQFNPGAAGVGQVLIWELKVKVETVQQQKDLKKMAAAGGKASRSLKKAVVKHPAYASWGSVVNAQVKAKLTPSSKCNLGKFLGIRDPPASDISQLITRFIKLNNRQNPGMKKDVLSEEKLRTMLEGKERVGVSEIAKLLAQQFPKRR
uniref:DM2 domain-containing protein n=1 Tax=Populus trichocarpa TaxID=3694 RepID=A0A2K2AD81_POPTR|eukprot:XP_024457736.1 uncharacterized protein LOC112327638 [Populus trichocarpa]